MGYGFDLDQIEGGGRVLAYAVFFIGKKLPPDGRGRLTKDAVADDMLHGRYEATC